MLIRFVAMRPDGEFVFWALPGGEIEDWRDRGRGGGARVEGGIGAGGGGGGPVYRDANQFLAPGGDAGQCRIFSFGRECGREEPRVEYGRDGGERLR